MEIRITVGLRSRTSAANRFTAKSRTTSKTGRRSLWTMRLNYEGRDRIAETIVEGGSGSRRWMGAHGGERSAARDGKKKGRRKNPPPESSSLKLEDELERELRLERST